MEGDTLREFITIQIYVWVIVILPSSSSGLYQGDLPNVLYEEPFFSEKQRSRSRFGGATKMAPAPTLEPLMRSPAKHPLTFSKSFEQQFV